MLCNVYIYILFFVLQTSAEHALELKQALKESSVSPDKFKGLLRNLISSRIKAKLENKNKIASSNAIDKTILEKEPINLNLPGKDGQQQLGEILDMKLNIPNLPMVSDSSTIFLNSKPAKTTAKEPLQNPVSDKSPEDWSIDKAGLLQDAKRSKKFIPGMRTYASEETEMTEIAMNSDRFFNYLNEDRTENHPLSSSLISTTENPRTTTFTPYSKKKFPQLYRPRASTATAYDFFRETPVFGKEYQKVSLDTNDDKINGLSTDIRKLKKFDISLVKNLEKSRRDVKNLMARISVLEQEVSDLKNLNERKL